MCVCYNIALEGRELSGAGQYLLGGSVHSLGQVTHVGRGDAGDRDSPVLGQVDAVVSGAGRHLLGRHPGEGEHTNPYFQSRLDPGKNISVYIFIV